MKRSLTSLASLALASLASATELRHQLLPYPSTLTSGTATQACIGQFTDDVVADGALLIGGNVQLVYAPQRVVSYSQTTGPFSSMAKVTLNPSLGREGLLVSTSNGLTLLRWDTPTRQLTSTSALTDANWANARELQAACFVAGSLTQHLCALSPTGNKILMADWDGTQIVTGSLKALSPTSPALALAGLNWNGDASLDLAYDDGATLRVVSNTGTLYWSFANTCAHPQVLRLARPGTKDDLVWLTHNPYYDEQLLTVVHGATGSIEAALTLGTLVAAHLTLADIDADGRQDLLVTRSDHPLASVLYQQASGSQTFWVTGGSGGGAGMTLDLTDSFGACSEVPVAAGGDLDGDGDDDLLLAGSGTCAAGARIYFANGLEDETIDDEHFVKPWVEYAHFVDWCWPDAPPAPNPDLAHLTILPWGLPYKGPAHVATDLRVTVWVRNSASDPMQPERLVDTFVSPAHALTTVDIPLPNQNPLPRYLDVDFSFVVRDAGGAVLQSFPGWTGEIDRTVGIPQHYTAGPETTGGIDRPSPPPPSGTPPRP